MQKNPVCLVKIKELSHIKLNEKKNSPTPLVETGEA